MVLDNDNISTLIVLVAAKDEQDIFRIATGSQDRPEAPGILMGKELGVAFDVTFYKTITAHFGKDISSCIENIYIIKPNVLMTTTGECYLCLCIMNSTKFTAPDSWPSLMQVLREMPKHHNRVAYIKALQILSGGLEERLDVVDLNDQELADLMR